MMWGIVPAAGNGTRIQPLAFSKELLPVGSRVESGVERPRAVSEYLVERMLRAGADRICFVISPAKPTSFAITAAIWARRTWPTPCSRSRGACAMPYSGRCP
jgi:UTP-glucose-1-phosphate uridylyltransferase